MHLKGGVLHALPVLHNEGVADADVEPEVGGMDTKQGVISCAKQDKPE